MTPIPTYMTTVQVQERFGFQTADGTLDFLHRHRLVGLRIGRRLLWSISDIDRLLAKLEKSARA